MSSLLFDDYAVSSSFTVEEAVDRVRGDLGLRDSEALTDTDIKNWLNEGNRKAAYETGWWQLVTLMSSSGGVNDYALPLLAKRIDTVLYQDVPLCVVTVDQLNRWNWAWRDETGIPSHWYVRGNRSLGLYPAPASGVAASIRVEFTGIPEDRTEAEEYYLVPPGAEDLILIYAKMLAAEKDINMEGERRWPIYKRQWEEGLAKLKDTVESVALGVIWSAGGYGTLDDSIHPVFDFERGNPIQGAE